MGFREEIRDQTYEALTGEISRLLVGRVKGCGSILDVGCGDGRKTAVWAEALGVRLSDVAGIEAVDIFRERAGELFKTVDGDLERENFPFPDGSFDLVIANQVFEHIKNIFHLMGEVCRVTKLGGHVLLSTPNLASAHNRALLLAGRQPTPIKVFCEHVRGFTAPALASLASASGDLEVVSIAGGGFYPLPPGFGNLLARIWARGAVYSIVLLKRRTVGDTRFWSEWAEGRLDTRW